MTNKNYEQKPRSFSLLRILLLTLIAFCCLFLGHYCLNVFYYKTVKTNSGLTYRVIPCKDLVEQPLAAPANDEKDIYILYQQEISYNGEIIARRADFTRRYKYNESILFLPYFMYLDSSSLNCIDGGIYELLHLCKLGVVLEAEVLAYTVLTEQNILNYKIHDINSKVKVRIYPIVFCSYDKINEELTKYNNKMLELQEQQRISNKEKIKDFLKKKYPKITYTEIENGFVIKTNDASEQDHIDEDDIVSFDISFFNITTGELISTTILADAIKDGRNVNVKEYNPMVRKVVPELYNYFKNLSSGGEYEIYTPLHPQFFGDTQLYLLKIKNLEVKEKKKNKNVNNVNKKENSNNVDNKEDDNERQENKEKDNEKQEKEKSDSEKQEDKDVINNEKEENKEKEENNNGENENKNNTDIENEKNEKNEQKI